VFTARYALSPYIKQIRFVFKGLKSITNEILKFYLLLLTLKDSPLIVTERLDHVAMLMHRARQAAIFLPQGIHTILTLHPTAVAEMQEFDSNKEVQRTKYSSVYFAVLVT
jgi:hypothetical protein